MKFDKFYHGGDYNPDQWLDYPDILASDIINLKKANINFVTLGVFSWAKLEPTESVYNFQWLDDIVEKLTENNIEIIMATPSGAKPAWLATKYPEVQRVNENMVRELHGNRHTHCITSPIYREKVANINNELAKRYANNKNVFLWHISNEFFGYCYCDLCIKKFRQFLKDKYKTIENLNKKWWNDFWARNFTSFDEINPQVAHGEKTNIALAMEWQLFTDLNTIDFYNNEVKAVKKHNENAKFTANFWGDIWMHLDYFEFGKHVDVVSFDAYPDWHGDKKNSEVAANFGFIYDLMRSIKNENFFFN